MNENTEELFDLLESGINGEETGMENAEVPEASEQSDTESNEELVDTVSDGVSDISAYDQKLDDIIEELIYQREQMDSLQEYIEAKDMALFEKPLEKYTVQEGLALLMFFLILFVVIAKMIGGIITCKI